MTEDRWRIVSLQEDVYWGEVGLVHSEDPFCKASLNVSLEVLHQLWGRVGSLPTLTISQLRGIEPLGR